MTAARALAVGWAWCEDCGTPYEVDDLRVIGPNRFVCRWHFLRRA